jgi:ABC-type multidrug transport system fused ATPase/permease subunit
MITCTALYSFFSTVPHYWLSIWTSSTSSSSTLFYILIYTLLTLAGYIATNGICYSSVLLIAPTSGLTLHKRLLHTILSAPLSYFSRGTSAALNRFSEDIQLVDKQLAGATHTLFVQVFKLLAQTILLIGVQPVLALTLPFCSLIVYAVQKVYLRTSRQLRLLEIESRSVVSASLLETVQGVETIRAFNWQSAVAEENVTALDGSQRPLYLLLCLQRWLNIVLDLMVASIAVGLVGVSVVWKGTTTGGMVGVGLNVILVANSTLLKLVEGWTSLEISLGAVARLKSVEMEVPSEEVEGEAGVVTTWEEWPTRGRVVLENVTGAYNADAVAFRHVFLTFEPGQVTLLCGRTGRYVTHYRLGRIYLTNPLDSGKSSLLLSLLRLINTPHGIITVDGVDISRVSRSIVRQRCFITVTQDPFFLPDATLRFNLDHSTALADKTIIKVLETTGLLTHFNKSAADELVEPTKEGHAILDQPLSALPIMSGGQAQLLAVARAILQLKAVNESHGYRDRHSTIKPVILLDEITSSLDAATEDKVYDLVQDEFVEKGHTVIMVTHKVGSYARRLRRSDRVVWMKDGAVEKIEEAATLQARLNY